ncbi:MAG TPA: peroxidase family protein [Mycobacteriales bacterium]|nr:peroxidase family protein [Mycobacteriales bacterium]
MGRHISRGTYARYALGGVRLAMGSTALLAPQVMVRSLGVRPEDQPAACYALRLFGVRTVVLAGELLVAGKAQRAHAVRLAPWIHASDTVAALAAGRQGQLPRRAALTAASVSGLNTAFAVVALLDSSAGPPGAGARPAADGPGHPAWRRAVLHGVHAAPWVCVLLRGAERPAAGAASRRTVFWRRYDRAAEYVDRRIGWDRLPVPLGLAVLTGVRNILRRENLHDSGTIPSLAPPRAPSPADRTVRSPDGSHNDLEHPTMGMAGTRFGRNVPLSAARPESPAEVLTPNPRVVSRSLMTRHHFQPASTLNVLAASWLQFMIRDWFSHGQGPAENPWHLPLAADDDWPEPPLEVPRLPADPTRPAGLDDRPPTAVNTNSHWWDASSIYGSSVEEQRAVRCGTDGKLHVLTTGVRPVVKADGRDPVHEPGFWLGLAMMHDLFTREHNAICDRLRDADPRRSDEELFQRARLINAALLAKIHTVEWTPAVISHPTAVVGLRANWWGLEGERLQKMFGRLSGSEALSGIPGSGTDHFGVPFSITEEFAGVYRMHPLIPDDFDLRAAADDASLRSCTLRDLAGPGALEVLAAVDMPDLFYSFGTEHPGAIVLDNFPRFLQEFRRPDGKLADLAATDILRSRELGVPRYNRFRRLLHLAPAPTFESLTDDPDLVARLRDVYEGDIEKVDLTVGMFAEKRPDGFAFSDTAFRIFILMASRRLNSDRFFTRDYTPEIYTPEGLAWIGDNTMISVLLRHHPSLRPALRGAGNAFAPWRRSGPRGG